MNQYTKEDGMIIRQTDQFKDMMIEVIYNYQKVEPDVTIANLLTYMMTDRSHDYPTKRLMNRKSDDLYGLSMQTRCSSVGHLHQFEARFKTLNPSFAKDLNETDVFSFIQSVLLRPLLDESSFNEAKINMKGALLRLQDNPTIQGVRLAIEQVCDNEPLSVYSQGNLSILNELSLQDVITFHHRLIQLKPVILVSADKHLDIFSLRKALGQQTMNRFPNMYSFKLKKAQFIRIKRELMQSTVTQAYYCNINLADEDYYRLRILSMMLGQLPNSLLFQEIREKRSLCYAISTSHLSTDGLLLIQTGIDASKIDELKPLIQIQIDRLRTGDFSESLLKIAKHNYIQNIQRLDEDRSAYFNVLNQHDIMGKNFEVNQISLRVSAISKADIQRVAQQLEMISESIIEGVQHA